MPSTTSATGRRKRSKKIGIQRGDARHSRAWASAVDRFFASYGDRKDEKFRPLSPDEEREMVERLKDDRDALVEGLVNHAVFLAVNVAGRYAHFNRDYDTLLSAAMMGLNIAARKFDPNRKNRFSTYAVWYIQNQIFDDTIDNSYVKHITTKTSVYLDSPEFTRERDEENFSYRAFRDMVEPSHAYKLRDERTPYERISDEESDDARRNLIGRITASVAASALPQRDKTVYEGLYVKGLRPSDVAKEMGITTNAVVHSRMRVTEYISSRFSEDYAKTK